MSEFGFDLGTFLTNFVLNQNYTQNNTNNQNYNQPLFNFYPPGQPLNTLPNYGVPGWIFNTQQQQVTLPDYNDIQIPGVIPNEETGMQMLYADIANVNNQIGILNAAPKPDPDKIKQEYDTKITAVTNSVNAENSSISGEIKTLRKTLKKKRAKRKKRRKQGKGTKIVNANVEKLRGEKLKLKDEKQANQDHLTSETSRLSNEQNQKIKEALNSPVLLQLNKLKSRKKSLDNLLILYK